MELTRKKYIKRTIIAVIITGFVISSIYMIEGKNNAEQIEFNLIKHVLMGIFPTMVIWLGCALIVSFLWKKFPWQVYPVKHLLLEIVLIFLYLGLFTLGNLIYMAGFDLVAWQKILNAMVLEIFNVVLITFLITVVHEAYFFYKQWMDNFSKSVRLEKENIQSQLNALKAQVNPHFLFNSLNSLMGLVDNNPKAEKYILDLSEYLRYVLAGSKHETVSLKEELENTDKYIRMMDLRFGDNLIFEKNIDESYNERRIPPLAVQMLVENCVKHNIVTNEQKLKIKIKTNDEKVIVSNNLQKKINAAANGDGLNNIKSRYSLGTEEQVIVLETETEFIVSLPLLK